MIGIVGDIMLDEYWFGSIDRFTPENKNTPIVLVSKKSRKLGGAGNVALNVQKLGDKSVTLYGVLGSDKASSHVSKIIKDNKLNKDIIYDNNVKTVQKIRVYDKNSYVSRIDLESKLIFDFDSLVNKVQNSNIQLLVVSDYNKGTIKDFSKLLEIADKKHIKCFVDPKGDLAKYSGAFLVKPNLQEFLSWSGLGVSFYVEDFIYENRDELLECRNKLKVDNLLITAGSEGAILVNDRVKLYKAIQVKEVDVTGAGDTFLAGLVHAYNKTNNLHNAITFANAAAAIAVTKKGTVYVRSGEVYAT